MSHVYTRPGIYQAKLVVTDNEGASTRTVFTGGSVLGNGAPGRRDVQVDRGAAAAARRAGCRRRSPAQAARPDLGETIVVEPAGGRVRVRLPGRRSFQPLADAARDPGRVGGRHPQGPRDAHLGAQPPRRRAAGRASTTGCSRCASARATATSPSSLLRGTSARAATPAARARSRAASAGASGATPTAASARAGATRPAPCAARAGSSRTAATARSRSCGAGAVAVRDFVRDRTVAGRGGRALPRPAALGGRRRFARRRHRPERDLNLLAADLDVARVDQVGLLAR